MILRRVCVFCGSCNGARPAFAAAAREMGLVLVRRSIELVYGGGRVGLMGVLADTVLAGGGRVIGVIPKPLATKELAHDGVELRVVETMHERKAMMAELSDGFVAMPGGYGTLEEFCEVLTWSQLGLHKKGCGLLNVAGYFDPLLALFDHAVRERFVSPDHRGLVLQSHSPATLLDHLESFEPPELKHWIDAPQV